ncbi:hypothetical protein SAMN05216582_10726 [Selenomonas ruminantium]|uniref:Uncharacterized protein n=1 Tax=Selenomonas ruminantium TaxID=971 RepID=A0A1M6TB39_SELRU|nr:hypothetical protein [Selenomonas ruminantium]SHK54191.1 hypothetical protein SAMN05216582_10726 [Selenomonas ruminantium]
MLYIINSLITEGESTTFSLVGVTSDKDKAAQLAADVYKDYNKVASFQNIEMITEWLATRKSYSFRKDKSHRLQLSITELAEESAAPENKIIFSAAAEQDELMRKVSEALFEGKHHAERNNETPSCPIG